MGKTNWKLISRKSGQNDHHLFQKRPTATLARNLLMGITRPFFIRFWLFFKLLFFPRRIEWWQNQNFISFYLDLDLWQHRAHGLKTTLKRLGRVLTFPLNSYFHFKVSKMIGLYPPPLNFFSMTMCQLLGDKIKHGTRSQWHILSDYNFRAGELLIIILWTDKFQFLCFPICTAPTKCLMKILFNYEI